MDLAYSRTPRQTAGRSRVEAQVPNTETVTDSPQAGGRTVSHEAIYRWVYSLPKGELTRVGIMLRSKRIRRKTRRSLGAPAKAPIVGIVSIDDRRSEATDRRVPGAWEGDLIIGEAGRSAAAALVERTSRYLILRGLPFGQNTDGLADVLIDNEAAVTTWRSHQTDSDPEH